MPILAPEAPADRDGVSKPRVVFEQPSRVEDQEGRLLEETVDNIVEFGIGSETGMTVLYRVVQDNRRLPGQGSFLSRSVRPSEATSWAEASLRALPGGRYFTPEERAQYDEIVSRMMRPLSKPLKRL
jgi:hypothetical protein